MFDEADHLTGDEALLALLTHYRALAPSEDRDAWQDRLMELPGVAAADLVRLHGELIAQGWVEQNTGATPSAARGLVPQCYRITLAGVRAHRQAQAVRHERAAAAEERAA